MTANSDHRDGPQSDAASTASPLAHNDQPRQPRRIGRNLRMTLVFLFVSAVVFCLIVVRQRDVQNREAGMRWAREIQGSLQKILDERKFLPQKLPAGQELEQASPFVPYPQPAEVSRLELAEQPFLLIAGPRRGLILPGQDGYACVMYDSGKVEAVWLSVPEAQAAQKRRQQLLAGPAENG